MKIRTHLAEAFLSYKHGAPQGAAKLAEVFEGLVLKAGREAASKTWLSKKISGLSARISGRIKENFLPRSHAQIY